MTGGSQVMIKGQGRLFVGTMQASLWPIYSLKVISKPKNWQMDGGTYRWTDRQTDDRQSDPYKWATLLLLTWIYFCRLGGTVNFTLPFMTNVTISISTSQIFRSWVAIFQSRPPMASLFRSLYGIPGLAPRMDVLSWGRRDFQISFSNRDTSGNAWNRHWGSFMVDTGMLNDILWPDHIQWQPPTDQTLYRTRPFNEFWVVSIEHLRRVWHADRGRLLLRTPGPVPLGLAYVLLVETNPFPNLSLFYRTMLFEYPSVLSRFCSLSGALLHWCRFDQFVVYRIVQSRQQQQ